MRAAHWLWVVLGLFAWALIVVLWATGPSHCTPPDQSGHVACEWASR